MREFKFIRGKYTDENIFNSDETNNCLFAYDSKSDLVEFTEKNDKEFQDKFAELSSEDRLSEIYTLRPSQFTISAKQKSDDSYDFTFTANEKVYDGSRQFPTNVIKKAEELIKANTTGEFNTTSKLPILNLDGAAVQKTPTTFTFKDTPSFKRNLVFKVSGSLNERGYTAAQGESIEEAYKTASGKIDYNSGVVKGTFYGGCKQQRVDPVEKIVVSNSLAVGENTTLTVASKYTPATGYAFICSEGNSKHFDNEIKYGEISAFDLYKKLTEYLEASNADDAVTISNTFANTTSTKYTLNNNNKFVSFNGTSPVSATTYYEEDTSSSNTDPIYASKVNDAPDDKLDLSTITFVSSDAINVSPVEKLIANAEAAGKGRNALISTVGVESDKLAYVKIGSAWTPASQVDVEFSLNGKKITLFSKVAANTYTVTNEDGAQINNVSKASISCTMRHNGNTVLAFKYFDKSSQNKYVVTANISSYLDGQAANDFIKMKVSVINTSYNLKNNYVAYITGTSLNTVYDGNLHTYYEAATGNKTKIDSTSYDFYYKVQANAYIFKKHFTVPAYNADTSIIKGYNNSYSGFFIRDGNTLRGLKDGDLTGNSISVYTKSDYHLFANGVYENSDDTTKYVMWSKDWQSVAIDSSNASVRNTDNTISPVITNEVFRLIDTVNVNATQSD